MQEKLLPFEKPLAALEADIAAAKSDEDRARLVETLEAERAKVFGALTPWERVQLARHPLRPRMLDFLGWLFEDFVELHGDRVHGDDPAMVCGIGRYRGRTLFVAGQQKGVDTDENIRRHFGMAHPEGYRKALRVFQLAERFGHPIVTFVDTPAAHPGIEAEQRGQGLAIARNLLAMSGLNTPICAILLSEGGSGGALGVAVADWVAMFEHAAYMICPPERCAEILWRDAEKKELAAEALKVTAADLLALGVIDRVLDEPGGGAHRNPTGAAAALSAELDWFLEQCDQGRWNPRDRQTKLRQIGEWAELPLERGAM